MRYRVNFLIVFALLSALVTIRAADPYPVVSLREAYFDTLQRISPRVAVPVPVRVVDIDEKALAEYGQWPWPRHRLAALVNSLRDQGAAVIVFDFLFSEPDRMSPSNLIADPLVLQSAQGAEWLDDLAELDTDQVFSDAMRTIPVVLGISDAGRDGPPPQIPMSGNVQIGPDPTGALYQLESNTPLVGVLRDAASGLGVVNISPASIDGTVREVPLVWGTANGVHNTLSIEALRIALGESTVLLFGADRGGTEALGLADITIPVSEEGTFRVYYRDGTPDLTVSAADILNPEMSGELASRIQGNIVFVGTGAAGLQDVHPTARGDQIPGVVIHAQVLEQILAGQFLERSAYSGGLELLILVSLGLLIFALMSFVGPAYALVLGSVAAIIVLSASWRAFHSGLLIDATYPLGGAFLTFSLLAFIQYAFTDRERRSIRRSFSKYVSGSVLSEIERQGHKLQLGGELRDVTVMFSDIRNFTPLSETLPPEELVALLNDLFSELTDDILKNGGTIDKYIGDSIMAFWNAPLQVNLHEAQALRAALMMRKTLQKFNRDRSQQDLDALGMSIGLAAGQACVGNIGSRERYNYSVIGETVNVSARVETETRRLGYDLVITQSVAEKSPGFALLPAGSVALKGVSEPVALYLAVGDETVAGTAAFQALARSHALLLQAVRDNIADLAGLILACKTQAELIEPGLIEFYEKISSRRDDFI